MAIESRKDPYINQLEQIQKDLVSDEVLNKVKGLYANKKYAPTEILDGVTAELFIPDCPVLDIRYGNTVLFLGRCKGTLDIKDALKSASTRLDLLKEDVVTKASHVAKILSGTEVQEELRQSIRKCRAEDAFNWFFRIRPDGTIEERGTGSQVGIGLRVSLTWRRHRTTGYYGNIVICGHKDSWELLDYKMVPYGELADIILDLVKESLAQGIPEDLET